MSTPHQHQHGVTIGGKRYTVDENGKFHPYVTPEHVTESMTESTATTGWAEDHKADRTAADQEDA